MEIKLITTLLLINVGLIFVNSPATDSSNLKAAKEATLSQDYKKAYELLKPMAKKGNVIAQYNLGVMYETGDGIPQNHKAASKWFRLAAEKGHAKAQNNLGNAYLTGEGVIQNYQEARKWYQLSADQGHPSAIFNLKTLMEQQL